MRNQAVRWALAAAALLAAAGAWAQAYPAKPVRLIVPYPPGGGTDTMGRLYAQKLGELLGQQVILDNRPGGGANIGAEIAAKAPPDGYTLLMNTIAHAASISLYRKLNYDLMRDFAHVSLMATTPHVVAVHPSLPVKTVKQLIALARARGGDVVYSSSGSGTPAHLSVELFNSMTGVKMLHVPYKGGGPSVIALLGGEVSVSFATTPSVLPHLRANRLRGVAVTTGRRSPATPDLPTIAEAGVPGYDASSWYGLLVPAGTPREIVQRLNAETIKLLNLPDVKERLDASGFEVWTSTPEEFTAFQRNEIEKWAKVVKFSGARAE